MGGSFRSKDRSYHIDHQPLVPQRKGIGSQMSILILTFFVPLRPAPYPALGTVLVRSDRLGRCPSKPLAMARSWSGSSGRRLWHRIRVQVRCRGRCRCRVRCYRGKVRCERRERAHQVLRSDVFFLIPCFWMQHDATLCSLFFQLWQQGVFATERAHGFSFGFAASPAIVEIVGLS